MSRDQTNKEPAPRDGGGLYEIVEPRKGTVMKLKLNNWRSIAILAILLATSARVSASAVADWADTARDWNAIAERSVATARHPPPVAALDFAIVQVAIYDAIIAIDGRYQPYYVHIPN